MRDMSCGRARRLVWGGSVPPVLVLPVERARAQAHVSRCPSCRRFLADMELLRRTVGAGPGTEAAPPELRQRVHEALSGARRRQAARRRLGRAGLGLAAALALIVLGARLVTRTESDPVLRIAGQERLWLGQAGIESSDQRAVHQWLVQRLPYEVHVPEFGDARLTGAAVVPIEGRLGAVIRFQTGGRFLTYVIAPDEASVPDSTLGSQRAGELSIVSWRAPGLLHVWLGPIRPEYLTSFARRCAEQARTAGAISAAAQSALPSGA